MNFPERYQTDCAHFSSPSFIGSRVPFPWAPDVASCLFWSVVHNEVLLHASMVCIVIFFLASLVVNTYLLVGLGHSEAFSWQPRYMLLKNLIVSDLLQSLTLAPSMLYCLMHRQTLSFGSWCLGQYFTSVLAIISSLLTVTCMSLERFVYICYSVRYLTITRSAHMYIFLTLIWLLALTGAGTSTLLVLTGGVEFGHITSGIVCELEVVQVHIQQPLHFETFNKVFVGCLLCICLLVFPFSYGRMYQEARQAQEPFQQDSVHARGTVAFYLGIFFLQLSPYTITFLTMFAKDVDSHLMLAMLVLVPPCINPLVYGMRNKEVRQALKCLCK